jgi:hypothetical protein
MPSADLEALEHLRQLQERGHVHGVVHLVALAPPDDPDLFEVELIGSIDDPRMLWTMVCAARAALEDEHGFTDADAGAAREVWP